MSVVRYSVEQSVAVVRLANAPVNCLSHRTRTELSQALETADRDAAVEAVVLLGEGKVFSAGADLAEFETPYAFAEPNLHRTLFGQIEAMAKPVIAAIHGMAVGGGCELMLGCHYRIAEAGAQIGLPEITLGFMPGAGGTQRLPRAIGLEAAVNMMLKGNSVSGEEAARIGLVDELIVGELLPGALAFARRVAAVRPLPLLRQRRIEHPAAAGYLDFVQRAFRGNRQAPPGAASLIEAVTAAVTQPFDRGVEIEFDLFRKLADSAEAKAFRHAFFAERTAGKMPAAKGAVPPAPTFAAVIGAGTMGRGIAICFIDAGVPVALLDLDAAALERGVTAIRRHYEAQVERKRLSPEQCTQALARLSPVSRYADIATADIAIEAVFEDMAVKQEVMRALDAALKPGAIIATNTSSLDVNALAAVTARPQNVLGLHFFSPANVMKLVEVVRADKTADEVLAAALALVRKMRKTAVISGVCDGFIGNRMIEHYLRQAIFLLEEGALPQDVDQALEAWGMAMGPFRMLDLVGNDIPWAVRKRRYAKYPDEVRPVLADQLCENGWFGQKSGRGWYLHAPGAKQPAPNPEVMRMIEDWSAQRGITRRKIAPAEIVERCVYALVNEGAAVLADGIAERASDIDVVFLTGYGFPRAKGGPMFHAESAGLINVVRRMRRYAGGTLGDPAFWTPHPTLVALAESGRGFADGFADAFADSAPAGENK